MNSLCVDGIHINGIFFEWNRVGSMSDVKRWGLGGAQYEVYDTDGKILGTRIGNYDELLKEVDLGRKCLPSQTISEAYSRFEEDMDSVFKERDKLRLEVLRLRNILRIYKNKVDISHRKILFPSQ